MLINASDIVLLHYIFRATLWCSIKNGNILLLQISHFILFLIFFVALLIYYLLFYFFGLHWRTFNEWVLFPVSKTLVRWHFRTMQCYLILSSRPQNWLDSFRSVGFKGRITSYLRQRVRTHTVRIVFERARSIARPNWQFQTNSYTLWRMSRQSALNARTMQRCEDTLT